MFIHRNSEWIDHHNVLEQCVVNNATSIQRQNYYFTSHQKWVLYVLQCKNSDSVYFFVHLSLHFFFSIYTVHSEC